MIFEKHWQLKLGQIFNVTLEVNKILIKISLSICIYVFPYISSYKMFIFCPCLRYSLNCSHLKKFSFPFQLGLRFLLLCLSSPIHSLYHLIYYCFLQCILNLFIVLLQHQISFIFSLLNFFSRPFIFSRMFC